MRFLNLTSHHRKPTPRVVEVTVIDEKEPFITSFLLDNLDTNTNHTMSARQPAQPALSSQQRSQDPRREKRPKRPALAEILADTAPAPWTLSAFTAYAAQNMCQENIDFTLDAKKYEALWNEVLEQSPDTVESPDSAKKEKLKQAWKRIARVYMTPNGPREINLPGDVRSALTSIPESSLPPSPELLKPALKKIYELMEESVFFPFLNDVQTSAPSRRSEDASEIPALPQTHSATSPQLHPSISHGSAGVEFSSRSRPATHAHNSLPLAHSRRPLSHPTGSQSSKISEKSTGSSSIIGSASGGTPLTEEPVSSMSTVTQEASNPSTTPPPSEAGARRNRQRSPSENPWRKIGSKLGFRKRSGSGLKEQSERLATMERGRSPGPVFEED